jgi:phospholipid-translocating ATPase
MTAKKIEAAKANRKVLVNITPETYYAQDYKNFTTNKTTTSKYTAITFLPMTLYEQFRRFSNIFFLVLAVVQFFPQFQTLDPIVAALPFILVLAATILKSGYEDFRRHCSDDQVNSKECTTIRNFVNVNRQFAEQRISRFELFKRFFKTKAAKKQGVISPDTAWQDIPWKNLAVGEFVLLRENDQIPADVLVISTSEKEGVIDPYLDLLPGNQKFGRRN